MVNSEKKKNRKKTLQLILHVHYENGAPLPPTVIDVRLHLIPVQNKKNDTWYVNARTVFKPINSIYKQHKVASRCTCNLCSFQMSLKYGMASTCNPSCWCWCSAPCHPCCMSPLHQQRWQPFCSPGCCGPFLRNNHSPRFLHPSNVRLRLRKMYVAGRGAKHTNQWLCAADNCWWLNSDK